LLVAAAGNSMLDGNPTQYPAALVQPAGLVVAASTQAGTAAAFSSQGSFVSLAAPGENVFGAVSSIAPASTEFRTATAIAGYGFASGTSFAAPQVAGAAAPVWGA